MLFNKSYLEDIKSFFEIKDYEVPIFRLWTLMVAFVCPFYGWVLIQTVPHAIEKLMLDYLYLCYI